MYQVQYTDYGKKKVLEPKRADVAGAISRGKELFEQGKDANRWVIVFDDDTGLSVWSDRW